MRDRCISLRCAALCLLVCSLCSYVTFEHALEARLKSEAVEVNRTEAFDLRSLVGDAAFTLVLHSKVGGGTQFFLDAILTTKCVLVTPSRTSKSYVRYSSVETAQVLEVAFNGTRLLVQQADLLVALKSCNFQKVFINHVLGFPLEFFEGLFKMRKRYVSVSHDFTWILDTLQPTVADLQNATVVRNVALQPYHSQIEMKFQTEATKECFKQFSNFKSHEVMPMPDFNSSAEEMPASAELVMAAVGDISAIKGSGSIVNLSRVHVSEPDLFEIGFKYIQLGAWRMGQVDKESFELGHKDGFRLTLRAGQVGQSLPNTTGLWQVRRCGRAATKALKFAVGHDFLQLGDWRLGVYEKKLGFSHVKSKGKVIWYPKKSMLRRHDLWERQISWQTSSFLVGKDFFKLGSWSFQHFEDRLSILDGHSLVHSLLKNGSVRHDLVPAPVNGSKLPRNVRVVVFGNMVGCELPGDNIVTQRFKGSVEFNELLREHRPNVMLVAPIWFETYSYTLTLQMLTGLPIIVRRPPEQLQTAVASRLKGYEKVNFSDFEDSEEVVRMAESMKSQSFREINPSFQVPHRWFQLLEP